MFWIKSIYKKLGYITLGAIKGTKRPILFNGEVKPKVKSA